MSFSSEVKDDLLSSPVPENLSNTLAYGVLLFGRKFSGSEISLLTEHRGAAEKYASVIASFTGYTPEIITTEGGKFKVCVTDREQIKTVFSSLDIIAGPMARRINSAVLDSPESRAMFIRGAFIVSGTVTDPEKGYHLEFDAPTGNLAKDLVAVFSVIDEELSIFPKIVDRNGAHVVYMKKSEDIEDTLALMGANGKCFELMDVKVMKNIRNTVNRRTNFENANLARTVAASSKQFDAIEKLRAAGVIDSLGSDMRELIDLRTEFPELSSSELAKKLKKPLSVSGVNHRFAKLIKMAEDMK